jgi:hypothetical protein
MQTREAPGFGSFIGLGDIGKALAFLDKFRPIARCNELGINFAVTDVSNNEGFNAGKS